MTEDLKYRLQSLFHILFVGVIGFAIYKMVKTGNKLWITLGVLLGLVILLPAYGIFFQWGLWAKQESALHRLYYGIEASKTREKATQTNPNNQLPTA